MSQTTRTKPGTISKRRKVKTSKKFARTGAAGYPWLSAGGRRLPFGVSLTARTGVSV